MLRLQHGLLSWFFTFPLTGQSASGVKIFSSATSTLFQVKANFSWSIWLAPCPRESILQPQSLSTESTLQAPWAVRGRNWFRHRPDQCFLVWKRVLFDAFSPINHTERSKTLMNTEAFKGRARWIQRHRWIRRHLTMVPTPKQLSYTICSFHQRFRSF